MPVELRQALSPELLALSEPWNALREAVMRSHGKKAGWKLEELVWWGLQG